MVRANVSDTVAEVRAPLSIPSIIYSSVLRMFLDRRNFFSDYKTIIPEISST